jgi:hypothetical protein
MYVHFKAQIAAEFYSFGPVNEIVYAVPRSAFKDLVARLQKDLVTIDTDM